MSRRGDDDRHRRLRSNYKRAAQAEWESHLPLSREELDDLLEHLDHHLQRHTCDYTLLATERWLERRNLDVERVSAGLQEMGGGCDCEVLANLDPETRV
jgi:uncharacterized protein DUF2695